MFLPWPLSPLPLAPPCCLACCELDGPIDNNGEDLIHAHDLQEMEKGDLMVTVRDADQSGWAKDTLIRGGESFRNWWYPPAYVERMCPYYFPVVRVLEASLFLCLFQ